MRSKIDGLNAGVMPIWEPGLEALVKANAERGRLTFTTDLVEGVEGAEAVFIAVGTPARRGDGHADLTYVFEAVRELAKVIKPGTVVVTKSTVPVGTGDKIEEILREEGRRPTSRSRPTPSSCAKARRSPTSSTPTGSSSAPRTSSAQEVLREIYRPLFLNRAPILITGRRTAELTKYAANAFLAVKISFINEIADLCEAVDADVQDVARGIGLDNRIGPKFLHAGPGYGGSCFPKDTLALLQTAEGGRRRAADRPHHGRGQRRPQGEHGRARRTGARRQRRRQADRRARPRLQAEHRRHARRAVDPAGQGAGRARRRGHRVRSGRAPAGRASACGNRASPTTPTPPPTGADALVIVTEWDEFRALDLEQMARVDARQGPGRPAQRL